jgi:hypothetical protein
VPKRSVRPGQDPRTAQVDRAFTRNEREAPIEGGAGQDAVRCECKLHGRRDGGGFRWPPRAVLASSGMAAKPGTGIPVFDWVSLLGEPTDRQLNENGF